MWYGIYDQDTGRLMSVGTEAMFEDKARPTGDEYRPESGGVYGIVDIGAERPDNSQEWDTASRAFVPRVGNPTPIGQLRTAYSDAEQVYEAAKAAYVDALETARTKEVPRA